MLETRQKAWIESVNREEDFLQSKLHTNDELSQKEKIYNQIVSKLGMDEELTELLKLQEIRKKRMIEAYNKHAKVKILGDEKKYG